MLCSFVGTIANMYLAEKKLAIVNWPIEGKKQYVFARQLPHTKTYIYFKYPPINVHWPFLVGTWIWLWYLTDILLKGLLSDGNPRTLLLQWGLSSLGFCSVSSDNFFIFRCAWLVLTHSWYFFLYISYLKKTERQKFDENFWKKNKFIKESWGGPTFKLWRGSWGSTFKL